MSEQSITEKWTVFNPHKNFVGIYNSRRIEDIPLKSAEDLLNLKLIWDQSLNHKVWRLSKTTRLSKVVAFIKNNYLKRF